MRLIALYKTVQRNSRLVNPFGGYFLSSFSRNFVKIFIMVNIAICGGGIAGLTTAIALKKAGYAPVIFEAAPEFKAVGAGLGLAANAIKALDKLGIKEEVIAEGRLLPSFSVLDEKGKAIMHTDSTRLSEKFGIDNFTIHRSALHEILLTSTEGLKLFSGKKCIRFEPQEDNIVLHFSDGSQYICNYLIAADGIHSPIRKQLLPESTPRFAGYTCWRAVIDNNIPSVSSSCEYWGRNGRFGLVPLAGNKLYWFATTNSSRDNPIFKNFKVKDLKSLFSNYHETVELTLDNTPDEVLIWNDIIDLKPIPRYHFGNILLIGDAAHATTPNLGQGASQAIEDAAVLSDELQKAKELPLVFASFEKRRLKRTHFIIRQSEKLGKAAQLSHPLLIRIRNAILRTLPSQIQEKQLKKLYTTDF